MVDFSNDHIADEAVQKFGITAIDAALSQISADASRTLSWGWQRALMSSPNELLQWLLEHPTAPFHIVRLLARLLNPDSEPVQRFGAGPWLALRIGRRPWARRTLSLRDFFWPLGSPILQAVPMI
jgi:hypothetical protein